MSDGEPAFWDGDVVGGLALVLSNVALLPAIWLLANRGDATSGVVLLLTFVASMLYHSCRAGFFCTMHRDLHIIGDYIFVYMGIIWIVTSLPFRILESAHDGQLHSLIFFVLFGITAFCVLARIPFAALPLVGIALPFFIIVAFVVLSNGAQPKRRRRLFAKGRGWFVLAAAVCLIIAGSLMFFTPESIYVIAHSLWHVFSMFGTLFIVYSRAY